MTYPNYEPGEKIKYKGVEYTVYSTDNKGVYIYSGNDVQYDTMVYLPISLLNEDVSLLDEDVVKVKPPVEPSKIVSDDIKHPDRYNCGGYECQRIIEAVTADLKGLEAVDTGHIIRYAWRWKKKQPIKSLKKIKEYCDDLITYLEKQGYSENDE